MVSSSSSTRPSSPALRPTEAPSDAGSDSAGSWDGDENYATPLEIMPAPSSLHSRKSVESRGPPKTLYIVPEYGYGDENPYFGTTSIGLPEGYECLRSNLGDVYRFLRGGGAYDRPALARKMATEYLANLNMKIAQDRDEQIQAGTLTSDAEIVELSLAPANEDEDEATRHVLHAGANMPSLTTSAEGRFNSESYVNEDLSGGIDRSMACTERSVALTNVARMDGMKCYTSLNSNGSWARRKETEDLRKSVTSLLGEWGSRGGGTRRGDLKIERTEYSRSRLPLREYVETYQEALGKEQAEREAISYAKSRSSRV